MTTKTKRKPKAKPAPVEAAPADDRVVVPLADMLLDLELARTSRAKPEIVAFIREKIAKQRCEPLKSKYDYAVLRDRAREIRQHFLPQEAQALKDHEELTASGQLMTAAGVFGQLRPEQVARAQHYVASYELELRVLEPMIHDYEAREAQRIEAEDAKRREREAAAAKARHDPPPPKPPQHADDPVARAYGEMVKTIRAPFN
jgi:hypothetical protein